MGKTSVLARARARRSPSHALTRSLTSLSLSTPVSFSFCFPPPRRESCFSTRSPRINSLCLLAHLAAISRFLPIMVTSGSTGNLSRGENEKSFLARWRELDYNGRRVYEWLVYIEAMTIFFSLNNAEKSIEQLILINDNDLRNWLFNFSFWNFSLCLYSASD